MQAESETEIAAGAEKRHAGHAWNACEVKCMSWEELISKKNLRRTEEANKTGKQANKLT